MSLDQYLKKKSKKILIQAWIDEDLAVKVKKFKKKESWGRLIEALLNQLVDQEKL